MTEKMYFDSAGVSDIGRQRKHNEDSLTSSAELGLFAVADGMGGHQHGDVASQTAIKTLLQQFKLHFKADKKSEEQENCYEAISEAIATCNNLILKKNHENNANYGEGMGTTLVGAYFLKDQMQAITFNVGDSRIYRMRNNDLKQITRDHTMYQEWLDSGEQGPAPSKNIIVKAVGLTDELSPDIKLENVLSGDVYLVCSDGLSTHVEDEILQDFMRENRMLTAVAMCKQLIDMANRNGGSDNISVIVVRVNTRPDEQIDEIGDESVTVRRIAGVQERF